MKKIKLLSVVFAAAILLTNCKKKEDAPAGNTGDGFNVSKQSNPAYLYFGGTWCGPCGAYGKPTKEALHGVASNKNVAFVSFQVYNSDPFKTTIGETTAANFGVTGVPTTFVGGNGLINSFGFSSNNAANQSTQQAKITEIMGATPACNTQISASISGTSINVNYKTKFWDATTDSFFVNFIAIESGLNATQYLDASTNLNVHDFVFRSQSGAAFYGDLSNVGATKDQIVSKTATLSYNASWKKENMEVIAIVWRKKGGRYGLMNTDKIKL